MGVFSVHPGLKPAPISLSHNIFVSSLKTAAAQSIRKRQLNKHPAWPQSVDWSHKPKSHVNKYDNDHSTRGKK